jgi:hypothetical protein
LGSRRWDAVRVVGSIVKGGFSQSEAITLSVTNRGRILELPGGRKITLEANASQLLELGKIIVVLLLVPQGSINNENVVAFDRESGRLLWRIPVRKHVYRDSPYTAISRKGSYVWAHNCLI